MAKLAPKAYTDNMLFGASETNPVFTPNPIGQYASGGGITPTLDPELLLAEANGGITKMTQEVSTGNYLLPPGSEFAALQYSGGYYIKMILENGIPEYNSNQTYYINSFVRGISGTKLYRSKINDNVGQLLTNTASWEELELLYLRSASTTQQGTVQMGAGSTTNIVIDATRTAALYAPKVSPALTGTPTAPTAPAGTNTTQLATTAYVTAGLNLKANLASPALTGNPTAPTQAIGDNSTKLATTAFVSSSLSAASKNPTDLGEIKTYKYRVGDTPPAIKTFSNGVKAYLFNGQTLTQAEAPTLFADRGWTGSVVLENRNGLVSIGMGAGNAIGTIGGSRTQTLTQANLPAGVVTYPGNNFNAGGSAAFGSTGTPTPFSIMQPYIVDAIYLLAW